MRIVHVVPTYLPATRYGGPIFSVHSLCAALARRGHDVHVFTTNVDGGRDSGVPLGKPVLLDGVSVWYFPVPALRRLYWAPALKSALRQAIGGFSLVHTHSVFLWPTAAAAALARRAGVPHIVAPRGMMVRSLIERKSPVLKRLWISLVEKRNLESASAIHVTSETEAAELGRFGLRLPPVLEVANGVDVADTAHPEPLPADLDAAMHAAPRTLLYLGRVNWKKGLDRLIRSLPAVASSHLVVVGNDEEGHIGDLRSLARELRVEDRVTFFPPQYGAAKASLFRAATLLVLPSYSENFGNVVLEAMAHGCPVVVTRDVGAAGIVQRVGGGFVCEGDPKALGDALRAALEDPAALRRMGERARAAVLAEYSWDEIARQMEGVYEQLVRARGGDPTKNLIGKERAGPHHAPGSHL